MKKLLAALLCVFFSVAAFSEDETNILFPKQLQPKLTLRQQCGMNDTWKEYGSVSDCVHEKRQEKQLAIEKERTVQLQTFMIMASRDREDLIEQLKAQREWEMYRHFLRK